MKHGIWNYTYDGNGNLITDPSKGTTGITYSYNLLNLPQTVTGSKTITYTYDANGRKLRRVSTTTTGGTGITDYINGIQYDDNNTSTETLSFIQTEEGKAVPTSGGGYNYTYYLGDNLGNTRVTFDTQTGAAAIVQADNYYPFGMEQSVTANGSKNEYLYNSKELQEETGVYDYGARGYDALLGIWNVIDPLAEKGRRWSPYVYGFDNSIRFVDPDGMWPWPSLADIKAAYNSTVATVSKTYDKAVATTKSAYNQTATAITKAGVATQKWTTEHKEVLLNVAKNMQETGDKTAVVGAGMAIAGAPVAGVGAAPGLAVASAGGIVSTAGTILEVSVDIITGNNKDAGITTGNELLYRGVEKLGTKAIDDAIPGASATVKVVTEQANKLLQTAVKTQTDKVVDKLKEPEKK